MENYKLVMPGHLNHYGFLFGGTLLKWVDEVAYITATLDYPGANFVTVAMDGVEFRRSVRQGVILRFAVSTESVGTTSVRYGVQVYKGDIATGRRDVVFSTTVTLVRVDAAGRKIPLSA